MSINVLVVEDDQEINELLGEYLSLENIHPISATTGKEAIHLALTHRPDAIILDLMLPDIDGFEVAHTLSSQRAAYDIPIVILSCMCQDCDKQKGFASGALFYMNKPFMPDDLLATLRRALSWRESLLKRPPMGTVLLGHDDPMAACQTVNQMSTDLFARTPMTDAAVGEVRDAVHVLGDWASQWNREHPNHSALQLDYRIIMQPAVGSRPAAASAVEWTMSEAMPGLLNDAFFRRPVTAALGGWGGAAPTTPAAAAPIAPPAKWLQVLAKTGAAKFEKDSAAHTVKFTRSNLGADPAGGALQNSTVPVVEIDGNRYPTRLRTEALAARQK